MNLADPIVELVAGPACGHDLVWPEGEKEYTFPWRREQLTYRLEESGKTAFFVYPK